MDNNLYLKFISRLVKSKQIIEEKKIFDLYENNIVSHKEITSKIISIKKVIVKVKLENSKILLIEDLPINFLLAYSIIVPEESCFLEFELKEDKDKVKYLSNDKILEKIKFKVNKDSIKKVNSNDLKDLKFNFEFEELKIIKEIKNYIKEEKKLKLDKIRLIKTQNTQLFIPTVKNKHFKLAKHMDMPIISLIKNNYIKDSNINVLDEKSQIEYIKPFFEFEEEALWKLINDKKIIRAVRDEIFFNVNKKFIERKLENVENLNINKEEILEEIENLNKYRLSSERKDIILPLWKSHEMQKFVEIENEKDFTEKSGVDFKLDQDYLKNIYIQTLNGEKAIFKKKYLEPKILDLIEKYSNKKHIRFSNIYDLVFALTLNDEVESIEKFEISLSDKVKELVKVIRRVCEITIKKSIEFNKIPENVESEEILDKYFNSVSNHLHEEFKKFKKKNNRNEFLTNVLRISNDLIHSIKTNEIEYSNLFHLAQISIILIKILERYDTETSNKIKELFEAYFKNNEFLSDESKVDLKIEEMINSLSFLKKISQKQRTYVVLKKEIDVNLLPKNVKIMTNPTIIRTIIKPNIYILKNIFPYSFKETAQKIKELKTLSKVIDNEIEVRGKKVKLKEEFYKVYYEYKTYKQIFENNFFRILIVKGSNQKS